MPTLNCPLCGDLSLLPFHRDKFRDYLKCQQCSLVFVPPLQHLSVDEEKAIYDLHMNDLDDVGYRRFLSRLATPLLARLTRPCLGLDFGCGPGPLLAHMLTEHGHDVVLYDPLFAPGGQYRQHRYDFITGTEVVEHFRYPAQEFQRLFELLQPDGLLALMTKLVIDAQAFAKWHYKNDPTHIAFYSIATLQWLADRYQKQLVLIDKDVMLFIPSNAVLDVDRVSI